MPSWLKKIFTTAGKNSELILLVKHGNIEVGTLQFINDEFVFKYSIDCPLHLRIKGLNEEIVRSKHLPPFFTSRIPSFTRPDIKEKLLGLDSEDPILLLGELGKKSAVSPYIFILDRAA